LVCVASLTCWGFVWRIPTWCLHCSQGL
jgi:hypothetical protein